MLLKAAGARDVFKFRTMNHGLLVATTAIHARCALLLPSSATFTAFSVFNETAQVRYAVS